MCTGSSLNKCTFNGQQCCDEATISLIDQASHFLVESDHSNFTGGLVGTLTVIDET